MSMISDIIEENRKDEIKKVLGEMKKLIELEQNKVSTEMSLDYQNGWLDAVEFVSERLIGDEG